MKNLLYILFPLLLVAVSGFGQTEKAVMKLNVIISSVADQNIKLENVTVIFHDNSSQVATLNERGEFVFSILENTKQLITFKKAGYVPKTIWVDIENKRIGNRTCTFNLQLVLDVKKGNLSYGELNFPVVKIDYCPKAKRLKYNKTYNTKMKTKYRKILRKIKNNQIAVTN